MVVVRLAALKGENDEAEETFTDNLSPHGVRVRSSRHWQPGDQVEIAPATQERSMKGEVVYCQRLDKSRSCVGLKLYQGQFPWRILQLFDNG